MKLSWCALFMAAVAITGDAADHVWLTIYDGNYAVVRDVRSFDLSKGENEIQYTDLSPMILDEPVRLKGNGVIAIEESFQFQRLNDDFLLQQSLGKKVEFLLRSGDTLSGVLVGNEGSERDTTARFVIQQTGGAIRTLRQADVKDYRFSTPPVEFRIKPMLTFKVDAAEAGMQDVEAAYQVVGLDWEARYILDLSGGDSTAVLSGWAVITNAAGKAFDHARVTLVTGQAPKNNMRLRLATDERMSSSAIAGMLTHQPGFNVEPSGGMHIRGGRESEKWVKADGADFRSPTAMADVAYAPPEHQQIYDLQFYTLPKETSLPDGAEKEFNLFAPTTIKTGTRYEYAYWNSPNRVGVYVGTKNTDSVGLGTPLPAGSVKVYRTRAGGTAEDVGEDRLGAVPVNEPIRIRVGFAEGLSVERKALKSGTSAWTGRREDQWEVRIHNERDAEIPLVIQDQFPGSWKVTDSSNKYVKTGEHSIEIPVTVPAESETVVTYTVQTWREWK